MSEYREYKKWLKDTLPKFEEWAESNEDDAGDCPLVQDEACWILGLIEDTESEVARLKAEVEVLKSTTPRGLYERAAEADRWRTLCEKLVERMKLINGPDNKCIVSNKDEGCANHDLIHEAESLFDSKEAGK